VWWKIRDTDCPLLQYPRHRPSTPEREPEHHTRGFLPVQDERAAIQLHHLTVIQSHPKPVRVELRRVWHRVSTPPSISGLGIKAVGGCAP
jgi:hypothetical protein